MILRKRLRIINPYVALALTIALTSIPLHTSALPAALEDYFSTNNILWTDPDYITVCTNYRGNNAADLTNVPDPWNTLITETATKYPNVDARLVAATLYIENRGWPDFDRQWPVSIAGAAGPWQFIPSTWLLMGTDGDGDGIADRNNPKDAVHAAFKHQEGSAGKPLIEGFTGNIDLGWGLTFRRDNNNLLSYMASYNGRGAPNNTPLRSFPRNENSDYVRMAYYVLASNFTQTWNTTKEQPMEIGAGNTDGSGGSGGGTCPGGMSVGIVNSEGFAFPVGGIAKSDISNNKGKWPCPLDCHHDGSGAFDIFHKDSVNIGGIGVPSTSKDSLTVGTSVFAIEKMTVNNIKIYRGIAGCYGMSFTGESGWRYWYGHVRNPSVRVGQQLNAGQQVAQIGERKCTGNGSLPHLHIDRGPTIGAAGGNSGSNASKSLVPIMNQLYEELP